MPLKSKQPQRHRRGSCRSVRMTLGRLGRSAAGEARHAGEDVAEAVHDTHPDSGSDVHHVEAGEHLLQGGRHGRASVDLEGVVLPALGVDVVGAVDGDDTRVEVDEHRDAGDLDLDGVGLVALVGAGVDDLRLRDVHGSTLSSVGYVSLPVELDCCPCWVTS